MNKVIFKELVFGKIKDTSKKEYLQIINRLISKGAQGIILGCTEIPLLIRDYDLKVATFNTAKIHEEKAIELALQ